MKPHLTWLISLPHATAIMKKLRQKKHRDAGYSVELIEIEDQRRVWTKPEKMFYAKYPWGKPTIFQLNIYYEKPDETLTDKARVSNGVISK